MTLASDTQERRDDHRLARIDLESVRDEEVVATINRLIPQQPAATGDRADNLLEFDLIPELVTLLVDRQARVAAVFDEWPSARLRTIGAIRALKQQVFDLLLSLNLEPVIISVDEVPLYAPLADEIVRRVWVSAELTRRGRWDLDPSRAPVVRESHDPQQFVETLLAEVRKVLIDTPSKQMERRLIAAMKAAYKAVKPRSTFNKKKPPKSIAELLYRHLIAGQGFHELSRDVDLRHERGWSDDESARTVITKDIERAENLLLGTRCPSCKANKQDHEPQ